MKKVADLHASRIACVSLHCACSPADALAEFCFARTWFQSPAPLSRIEIWSARGDGGLDKLMTRK